MQELRIALTVLPVGRRGQAAIQKASDDGKPIWFALQISAGFADPEDVDTVIDGLWPWVLHVIKTDKLELNAWVGTTALADVKADVTNDDFAKKLQKAITDSYTDADVRKTLDVRLLRPADAGNDADYQSKSFPARVQYLATLPGELSSRLLATLYVPIKVDDLFVKNNNVWEPKEPNLFIAPKVIKRSAEIPLNGPPTAVDGFLSVKGDDGGLPIIAFGPGFDLERFTKPRSMIFDLETYDVPVALGDRRYVELESLILDVLDPFAELDQLRVRDVRENVTVVDVVTGARRVVPQETFDALVEIWRVRAFALELTFAFPDALRQVTRLLVPENTPALPIPARWGTAFATELAIKDVLPLAEKLAARIGIANADARTTLRRVSEQGGFASIASLIVQALDEILSVPDNTLDNLRKAWRFGKTSSSPELPGRRNAVALTAIHAVRERRVVPPLVLNLAGGALPNNAGTALRDALKANIALKEWPTRREQKVVEALIALGLASKDETLLEFAASLAVDQAAVHVDASWPATSTNRSELPGRGLSLLVGPEAQRVVHEDNRDADDLKSPYREVAGVLLLARRGKDDEDLKTRKWRLATGGTAFIGDLERRVFAPGQTPEIMDEEWLQSLLPLPLRPVFQQKVTRADLEYHGQPMLTQSALDQAYGAEDYTSETPDGLPAAYSFQSLGNFEAKVGEKAIVSRPPALRYGDAYEFRSRVIDQAGGLAPDVADATKPWLVDLTLPLQPKDPVKVVRYLRAVPVGDLNVLPGVGDPQKKEHWPALPDDVTLRAREWWALAHKGGENVPTLLLSSSKFQGTLAQYEFRILPPAIDEHTLTRWAYPTVDDPNRKDVVAELKKALTALLEARKAAAQDPDENTPALQLHDPAVTKLGIRIRGAKSDGKIIPVLDTVITLGDVGGQPYLRPPVPVRVKASASGNALAATVDATGVDIVIPEGSFASVEVFPLVTKVEFDTRFVALEELIDTTTPFADHVAFRPTVVLLEGAIAVLPDPKDLYDAFKLVEQNDEIAVRFEAGANVPNLVFVDRFAIERDRWMWRNLPILSAPLPNNNPAERRRLAASGPPKTVFDPMTRDTDPGGLIADWERLAGLDRGFVDRGELAGRWPRVAPSDATREEGGPGIDVLLAMDNRDAVTAADYLRFGLRVRSRYAGVLEVKQRRASNGSIRRRIVMPFRGLKIKPPKILAIVPFTASVESDPMENRPGVSPFMVLLDESFFREYGIGERLEFRLVLENLDIGEDLKEKLPYRTGPLADHWLPRQQAGDLRYYRGKRLNADDDEANPIALDMFGPFGYSLDITPSEALANASAFIAYPPTDLGPHWAMFARMRRVLDLPSAQQRSDWSDTHALYTLPDTRLLAKTGDRPSLELTDTKAILRNIRFILDPSATLDPNVTDPLKNSEAASQYRYFLLVSRVVPGAGLGFDAELPIGLWRLPAAAAGYQQPATFTVEHRSGEPLAVDALLDDHGGTPSLDTSSEYRGRVVEVMLNGRYEAAARLDTIGTFRKFWESLLEKAEADEIDAAGMIRRVSQAFVVLPR